MFPAINLPGYEQDPIALFPKPAQDFVYYGFPAVKIVSSSWTKPMDYERRVDRAPSFRVQDAWRGF